MCIAGMPVKGSAGLHPCYMATGFEEHDRGACHLGDLGRQLGAVAGSCVFTDSSYSALLNLTAAAAEAESG